MPRNAPYPPPLAPPYIGVYTQVVRMWPHQHGGTMLSDSEGWVMGPGRGRDGYEDAQGEAARERAGAVEERMLDILVGGRMKQIVELEWYCPECEQYAPDACAHLATCELLRARAENEVDAAERAR